MKLISKHKCPKCGDTKNPFIGGDGRSCMKCLTNYADVWGYEVSTIEKEIPIPGIFGLATAYTRTVEIRVKGKKKYMPLTQIIEHMNDPIYRPKWWEFWK